VTIMPVFRTFTEEARIICNLLAGYTDLEVSLLHCVQVVRDDFDAVLKAMFRVRGETNRVNIADGLGLNGYRALGLQTEFSDAISAMRYCVSIRNQFAHSVYWDDSSGRLAIAALEDAAELDQAMIDFTHLPVYHIDVPLLTAQEGLFLLCARPTYMGQLSGTPSRREAGASLRSATGKNSEAAKVSTVMTITAAR
jgi:hypothetical protein